MSIKKKLRQAFEASTPNVLDRVLQQCPGQENTPAQTAENNARQPNKPHRWVREALATAAAFVLLAGIVGGAVWYSMTHGGQNSTLSTDPTVPTYSTEPTGIQIETDVDFEGLTEYAISLACPDWDPDRGSKILSAQLQDTTDGIVYRVELYHRYRLYSLDFDAYTGQIVDLELPAIDSIKKDYISGELALQIAALSVSADEGWYFSEPALVILQEKDYGGVNSAYYYITASRPAQDLSSDICVSACTGQIVAEPEMLNDRAAIRILLENLDSSVPADQLSARLVRIDDYSYYSINLEETQYYVDAYKGILADGLLLGDKNIQEMNTFNELFGNMGSWYNMALTCQYASPAELRLENFFYNGLPGETNTATDNERSLLKAHFEDMEFADLIRLPVGRMNKILTACFGVTVEELNDEAFDGLVYLESTDCYYMMHSDALATENFCISAIEKTDDGTIRLTYTTSYNDCENLVVLVPRGDSYQILSNTYSVNLPDGNIGPERAIKAALEHLGCSREEARDLSWDYFSTSYFVYFTADGHHYEVIVDGYSSQVKNYYQTEAE